ncbi:N-terminal acetyltransferase [Gryganskiella cystojenkinii]|nr:N-terminal acetyltransferase [Gryganskiella cystojenkinii]
MTTTDEEHFSSEQVFAILRRINYPLEKPDQLPPPTLETLRELEYRCVTSISFDTLALRMTPARAVDISLEGIFDRVVNQRRGGWCFSLNKLAYELLLAIGFTVQYTLARVCKPLNYLDPIRYGGLTHRVSIVHFEDGSKYVFDIGFGATSFYPLKLEEGFQIEYFGHKRRINKVQHNKHQPEILGNPPVYHWRVEEYLGNDDEGNEKWSPCYAFNETQYYDPDCVVGNFYSNFAPTSPFIKSFWVMQATLDGKYLLLLGRDFKIRTSEGDVKKITIETEQQRLDILKEYYGIELTEEEWEYHDQKIESS